MHFKLLIQSQRKKIVYSIVRHSVAIFSLNTFCKNLIEIFVIYFLSHKTQEFIIISRGVPNV